MGFDLLQFKSLLKIGMFISIQIGFLINSQEQKGIFCNSFRKKRKIFFWSVLIFNGMCVALKKKKGVISSIKIRSFFNLEGFTGVFLLNSPNIINIGFLRKFPVYQTRKSKLLFLIKRHHRVLKRLRLKFS